VAKRSIDRFNRVISRQLCGTLEVFHSSHRVDLQETKIPKLVVLFAFIELQVLNDLVLEVHLHGKTRTFFV
jgi:hypothetical protein